MNLLVTGSSGFIGKNLIAQLKNIGHTKLFLCDSQTTQRELQDYLKQCDVIVHLAGVNRPADPTEYKRVHQDFTVYMVSQLKLYGNFCPIIAASSIQAAVENPYGKSKQRMEEVLVTYSHDTGASVTSYRLPNVFGKWCRPHYNSVIATFCYEVARNNEIYVYDENQILRLVHIDDVVEEFINAIESHPTIDALGFGVIPIDFSVSLKEIAEKLKQFYNFRNVLEIPSLEEAFDKKLYSTYISYLPEGQFNHLLDVKKDNRGYFSEILKSQSFGQISISLTKPGVVRGDHWHHIKNEKFLVVEGEALIRFRKIGETEVTQYQVSGKRPEIVDVPSGYTHTIENTGDTEVITLIWCSEKFYGEKPDTYFEEV